MVGQNVKLKLHIITSVEIALSGNARLLIDFRFETFEAVQHERGPRTSTVRRQLQGHCYPKDRSISNSPPLDLTPKRSPECSTTCSSSTPPSRFIPDSPSYMSAFRPQSNNSLSELKNLSHVRSCLLKY